MVVDSSESELSLMNGLFDYRIAGEPFRFRGRLALVYSLRRLTVVAREGAATACLRTDIAKAWTPEHRGIQRTAAALNGRRERDDVVLTIEPEVLSSPKSGRILELEGHRRSVVADINPVIRRAGHSIQRGVQPVRCRFIVHTQEKRRRLIRRQRGGNQIDRFASVVTIVLEPPADDAPASVRKRRLDRRRFHNDLPLNGVSEHRNRRRTFSHRWDDGRPVAARGRPAGELPSRDAAGVGGTTGAAGGARNNERLVAVEHQKGQENGDENATFHRHYRGTGSTPWRPKG